MSKFLSGESLEEAIYEIIWSAKNNLVIVSPYIKLDDYFKKLFDKHVNNPSVKIVILFGKNQGSVSKSFKKHDFDYFKKFLNISIIYVPELHAKYYANESMGLVTSMNLYDYSFKNNIEYGVCFDVGLFKGITNSADKNAWERTKSLMNENEVVFVKRPVYQKRLLSSLLGNNYVKSDVLYDVTDKFYGIWKKNIKAKNILDFPDELFLGSEKNNKRPTREEIENVELINDRYKEKRPKSEQTGYCIRTGVAIPFNPYRPLCLDAYESWAIYGNPDYPENYCHRTGRRSNGKTSYASPFLYDY